MIGTKKAGESLAAWIYSISNKSLLGVHDKVSSRNEKSESQLMTMKKRALVKAKEIETGDECLISENKTRKHQKKNKDLETKSALPSPTNVIHVVKRQSRKQSVNTTRKI